MAEQRISHKLYSGRSGLQNVGPDYTAHEKAAIVTLLILEGASFTTSEIAAKVGVTFNGAKYLMEAVSRVVPVYDDGGIWRKVD